MKNQIICWIIAAVLAVCCHFYFESVEFKVDSAIRSWAIDNNCRIEDYEVTETNDNFIEICFQYIEPEYHSYYKFYHDCKYYHCERYAYFLRDKDNKLICWFDTSSKESNPQNVFDSLLDPDNQYYGWFCNRYLSKEHSLSYPLVNWSWILYCLFLVSWLWRICPHKGRRTDKKSPESLNSPYKDYKELPSFTQIIKKIGTLMVSFLDFIKFCSTICFYACPYFIWVLVAIYFQYDFFFTFIPQTFLYYVVVLYCNRKKQIALSDSYLGTDREHCSVNDSYKIKRNNQKSWNPIIALLDFFCQYYPGKKAPLLVPYLVFLMIPAAWCFFLSYIHNDRVPISKSTYAVVIIMSFVYLCSLFGIDRYYRQLRHSYFKKNDKAGPYGWGTLDYNRNDTYQESVSPLDITYGIEKVRKKLAKY